MNLPVVSDPYYSPSIVIWTFFGVRVTLLPAVLGVIALVYGAYRINEWRIVRKLAKDTKIWSPRK
jgi:hypothetical protein